MKEYLNKLSLSILKEYYYDIIGTYPKKNITKNELIDILAMLYKNLEN